jgi:hypothetical protein
MPEDISGMPIDSWSAFRLIPAAWEAGCFLHLCICAVRRADGVFLHRNATWRHARFLQNEPTVVYRL